MSDTNKQLAREWCVHDPALHRPAGTFDSLVALLDRVEDETQERVMGSDFVRGCVRVVRTLGRLYGATGTADAVRVVDKIVRQRDAYRAVLKEIARDAGAAGREAAEPAVDLVENMRRIAREALSE